MTESTATRRQLEASLRALLPESTDIGKSLTSSKPAVAAVALGGVVTGYAWGRVRARRIYKKKLKKV